MKHARTWAMAAVSLALTLLLLGIFFWRTDWHGLWLALRQARMGWVLASVLFAMLAFWLRALRWASLLQPLGKASMTARLRALMEGYAVTNLAPGRAGELLRPYLLCRDTGMPYASVLATVVLERLMDMLTLLAFLGVYFAWHAQVLADGALRQAFLWGAAALVAASLAGGGVMFYAAMQPEKVAGWAFRIMFLAPSGIREKIQSQTRGFFDGLAVLRKPSDLPLLVFQSVLVWLCICVYLWTAMLAVQLPLGFFSTLLLIPMTAVGISLPTPGGIGGYHAALQVGLADILGMEPGTAAAAALISHGASYVPVTLFGLGGLLQRGLPWGAILRLVEAKKPPE